MADLFDQDSIPSQHKGNRPLADRCRPTKIIDVIGQQKLLAQMDRCPLCLRVVVYLPSFFGGLQV